MKNELGCNCKFLVDYFKCSPYYLMFSYLTTYNTKERRSNFAVELFRRMPNIDNKIFIHLHLVSCAFKNNKN